MWHFLQLHCATCDIILILSVYNFSEVLVTAVANLQLVIWLVVISCITLLHTITCVWKSNFYLQYYIFCYDMRYNAFVSGDL